MKPFPWLALIASFLFSGAMGSLSYCFWHGIGPKFWYLRKDKLWRLLASGTLPVAFTFLSLTIFGVAKNSRPRIYDEALNHLMLVIQVAGGVCLGGGVLVSVTMFYFEKPRFLIPPAFRLSK
jgi:hypothetical protein